MKLNKRLILQAVVVVVLGTVTWFWLSAIGAKKMASPNRARAEGRPIPVRTAEVERGEVADFIGATGVTIPSETAAIIMSSSRAYETGDLMVQEVLVWEGKQVQKGEVLFRLDERVFRQAVSKASAEVASAEADLRRALRALEMNKRTRRLDLESAEAEVEFRREDHERLAQDHKRLEDLHEKGLLSTIEYNASRTALTEAAYRKKEAEYNMRHADADISVGLLEDEERVADARQRLEVARSNLEVAQRDLDRCTLLCPIDGFADVVRAVPGEVVAGKEQLTRIHRLDPIHFRANLPATQSDEVYLGQEADTVLDSMPGVTTIGKVIRIASRVDDAAGVLPVIIEIPNPDYRIKPGLNGFARLKKKRVATTVPAASVVQRGKRAMVFAVENGVARIREVRVGSTAGEGFVEVLEGLEPGEQVVVYGNGHLENNDPVDADWERWARRD